MDAPHLPHRRRSNRRTCDNGWDVWWPFAQDRAIYSPLSTFGRVATATALTGGTSCGVATPRRAA